jgi:uncharacterized membrane protein YfhO
MSIFSAYDTFMQSTKFMQISLTKKFLIIFFISFSLINIQSNSNNNSILVLTDVFYPGWTATVDGNPTEIFKANGLVRSVFVPAGEHFIEFEYVPYSFTLGLIISFITLIILVGAYTFSRKSN